MSGRPPYGTLPLAQQENNGFRPLLRPRGKTATIASVVIAVIGGTMLLFAVKEKEDREGIHFILFIAALLTLSLVLGELLRRFCLVFEEIRHKYTRYEGKWRLIFKATLTFEHGKCILVAATASALTLIFFLFEHYEVFCCSPYVILFSLNCFVIPQLLFLLGLRQPSTAERSEINERENKNVAEGLAWSYYFGYLKLVLPRLERQIAKSEQFRFKIKHKRLFILLPKSCYTYPEIAEADYRVKSVGNLPGSKINRGGIKDRIYKHTVHRVEMLRPDGTTEEYYFVLEYATALMSLYQMSQNAAAPLSYQDRTNQVSTLPIKV